MRIFLFLLLQIFHRSLCGGDDKSREGTILVLNHFFYFAYQSGWETNGFIDGRRLGRYFKIHRYHLFAWTMLLVYRISC